MIEPGVPIAEDVSPVPPGISHPNASVAEIDFDYLRLVIEAHFNATETANSATVRVWSSRTESLLALNLNLPLDQE